MFRLSVLVGLLAAVPAVAYWTGRALPPLLFLAVVLGLLAAGLAALVLGVQHMRALATRERTRR